MIEQMPNTIKVSWPEGIIATVIPTAVSEQFSNTGVHEVHIEWSNSDGTLTGTVVTTPLHLTETLDKGGFFEPASLYKHYASQPNLGIFHDDFHHFDVPSPKADLSQIAADLSKLPAPQPTIKTKAKAKAKPWPKLKNDVTSQLVSISKAMADMADSIPDEVQQAYSQAALTGNLYLDHEGKPIGKVLSTQMTPDGIEIVAKLTDDLTALDGGEVIPDSLKKAISSVWGVPFDLLVEDELADAAEPKKISAKSKYLQEANATDVMKHAITEASQILWAGFYGNPWPDKTNTLNGAHTFQLADGTMLEVLLTVKPKEVKP